MTGKHAILVDDQGHRLDLVYVDMFISEAEDNQNMIYDDISTALMMLKPRWDGSLWIETATPEEIQAEINALPKSEPAPEPIALLSQAVTDLEIRDIEKEILLTDLEIEIAELKSDLEVERNG